MNVRSSDIDNNEKIQRIMDATLELIAENGLHNTPMSQIIKYSGVSAGTIYHYFSSKDELINQGYLILKKEMMDATLKDYDKKMPYQKRFFQIWSNAYDYLISNSRQMSFVEQCSTSPLITNESKKITEQYLAPLTEFILEGIETKCLKKMDIQVIFSIINSMIITTAKLQLSGHLAITDKHRNMIMQASWDALKRE